MSTTDSACENSFWRAGMWGVSFRESDSVGLGCLAWELAFSSKFAGDAKGADAETRFCELLPTLDLCFRYFTVYTNHLELCDKYSLAGLGWVTLYSPTRFPGHADPDTQSALCWGWNVKQHPKHVQTLRKENNRKENTKENILHDYSTRKQNLLGGCSNQESNILKGSILRKHSILWQLWGTLHPTFRSNQSNNIPPSRLVK